MSIRVSSLSVYNFRSFAAYDLSLGEAVNVLVGRNAAGKTNLVECLQLLTSGQSFRRPSPRDLVRQGAEACRAQCTLEGEGRLLEMGLAVAGSRRTFSRNGKKVTAAGVRGVLPSVLFCPDHLDMVKRSASVRRAALDDFGVQLNEQYARLVSTYERTVEQRNNLLKEPYVDRGLLAAWDESISATGAALTVHRMSLLARIREHAARAYGAIAPGELLGISYSPSIYGDEYTVGDKIPQRGEVQEQFLRALDERRDEELRRGITLTGPHRDEILFCTLRTGKGLSQEDLAQRVGVRRETIGNLEKGRYNPSLVLAWKIAEVAVTRDILGRPPLLLLDDVMSELDASRRESIMHFIEDGVQTVITTTNLGYFSDLVLEEAKVVEVGE